MEVLALIPARAHSKGILDKNLRQLGSKPLVAHAIEAALKSSSVSRVVVSTDSPRIKKVSEDYGAEAIMRPPEFCTDSASSESALLHAIEYLENLEGYHPDWILFIQCTNPLISGKEIDEMITQAQLESVDSMLSVVENHGFIWRHDKDQGYVGVNHDKTERKRRQDLEQEFRENGALYLFKTNGFLKAQHRFFGKIGVFLMDSATGIEIDTPMDFALIEARLNSEKEKALHSKLPDQIAAIVFDFDGVFTSNHVTVSENGIESVNCSRSDGMAIKLFQDVQPKIELLVLSSERNPTVQKRCEKLKLQCLSGIEAKLDRLRQWIEKREIPMEQVIYLGNDVNDLECIRSVGCGAAVSDAEVEVISEADMILSKKGGDGAVRELLRLVTQKLSGETRAMETSKTLTES